MKKLYHKHYVKRDPATLRLMEDGKGKPVVGEFIRTTTLTEQMAGDLNAGWRNTGVFWVEQTCEGEDCDIAKPKKETAKEKRARLFAFAKQLKEQGKLEEMPPISIKTKDLEEKLNQFKED